MSWNYIKKAGYDILAVAIVGIWGTTFISSAVLLEYFSPAQLFAVRFSIAYIGMWAFSHDRLMADSWKDELKMVCAGITGGSLYFLSENTALDMSAQTSAVSFIVCTTPLITALGSIIFRRKGAKMTPALAIGSLLALTGVAMIVFNGKSSFGAPVQAYFLALLASCSWAAYTIVVDNLSKYYPSAFITRKVFFWGLVTISPVLFASSQPFDISAFTKPIVLLNVIFLSVVASLACYALWNPLIHKLGTIRSSNYLYLNPLFTLIGSMAFLNERLTLISVCGSLLTLSGVVIAGRMSPFHGHSRLE